WGAGNTLRQSAVGGLGSADAPSPRTIFLPRAFVSPPPVGTFLFYTIPSPGPGGAGGMGPKTPGTGPIYYLPTVATGPMGTKAGQYTTNYGFGQTTGTVLAQQSTGTGGQDFFTAMGSDARPAVGAGNLALVAGGLSFRNTLARQTPSGGFQKVKLTLGAPIPSLSPAALAAAAALVLLAAGWAMRRRLG